MKTTSLLCTGAACCAFVATPAPAHLGGMLDSVKVSAASHGFAADVAFAHAEALRRGVQMVVCKSPDGERCAASGSWRQGWMVFQDADGNGRRSPGEPVVLRERALSRSLRVAGSLEKADAVAFDAAGATRLVDSTRCPAWPAR